MAKETSGGNAFDKLAKALVRVPKLELDRQVKRHRAKKKNRKS